MPTLEVGQLRLTVLADGQIELPANYGFYSAGSADEEDTVAHLNAHQAVFGQNVLLVDSPHSGRTLVDTGVGSHALLDSRRFGPEVGQLTAALTREGVDPGSIDRVLITHLHPDHCWGLITPNGEPVFKNASLHVHRAEIAHWTRLDGIDATTPETDGMRHIGALVAVRPYLDRLVTFDRESDVADDIVAVPMIGHTPGHTIYRFQSDGATLLSWGDLFHNSAQVEFPTMRSRTDTSLEAASQRQAVLLELSTSATLVHAYHFPFPGLGRIRRDGTTFQWSATPSTDPLPREEL